MKVVLLPMTARLPQEPADAADIVWLTDQPSPFGKTAARPYQAILMYREGPTDPTPGAHCYEAELVTGKEGLSGPLQMLALIQRREGMAITEAFRHWDEHIPLAVAIHHKALRYRQFRFINKLSTAAPDYLGLAVLDFAGPDEMRTGMFHDDAEAAIITADVDEFVGHSDVMVGRQVHLT